MAAKKVKRDRAVASTGMGMVVIWFAFAVRGGGEPEWRDQPDDFVR